MYLSNLRGTSPLPAGSWLQLTNAVTDAGMAFPDTACTDRVLAAVAAAKAAGQTPQVFFTLRGNLLLLRAGGATPIDCTYMLTTEQVDWLHALLPSLIAVTPILSWADVDARLRGTGSSGLGSNLWVWAGVALVIGGGLIYFWPKGSR